MDSNEPTGYLLDVSPSDDFFEQIVGVQNFASAGVGGGLAGRVPEPMMLQLGFGQGAGHMEAAIGGGAFHVPVFRSGLSLDQGEGRGFFDPEVCSGSGKLFQGEVVNQIGLPVKNVFHDQPAMQPVPRALHPPASRPRIRAKRGQGTDPHSIAERLRRARIAEKVRALQELVPSVNTSDRGAMIDEIVDYVKFLRQQVKVLSMSRLVTDIPVSSSIGDKMSEGSATRMDWEKWADDGTERQATKLMEENVGAAMQFLHSKALCVMPLSLFVATFHSQPPDASSAVLGSHTTLLPI